MLAGKWSPMWRLVTLPQALAQGSAPASELVVKVFGEAGTRARLTYEHLMLVSGRALTKERHGDGLDYQ